MFSVSKTYVNILSGVTGVVLVMAYSYKGLNLKLMSS